jgi:hypothetical protein
MNNILQNKGITGLYKGLLTSCIGIAPFIGVRMSVFDNIYNNKIA